MYPTIDTLLPHRAPMLLLTAVALHAEDLLIAHSERQLLDALLPSSCGSALLSLELMAQAAAAYAGLAAAADTGPADSDRTPGMLLGSRSLEVNATVDMSERLLVGVYRRSPLTGAGLAKFAGRVWAGSNVALEQTLAAARALAMDSAAGAAVFTAVAERAEIDCLATADVSVYLPTGEH